MSPTVPLDHDCGPENQQNRTVTADERDARKPSRHRRHQTQPYSITRGTSKVTMAIAHAPLYKNTYCKGTVCYFVIFGPFLYGYIQLYDVIDKWKSKLIIEVHVVWLFECINH